MVSRSVATRDETAPAWRAGGGDSGGLLRDLGRDSYEPSLAPASCPVSHPAPQHGIEPMSASSITTWLQRSGSGLRDKTTAGVSKRSLTYVRAEKTLESCCDRRTSSTCK